MDEMLKAAADSGDYLRAHPYEADSKHNPFVTHHGTGIFGYYAKYPDKAERFAKAMAGWRKSKHTLIRTSAQSPSNLYDLC